MVSRVGVLAGYAAMALGGLCLLAGVVLTTACGDACVRRPALQWVLLAVFVLGTAAVLVGGGTVFLSRIETRMR